MREKLVTAILSLASTYLRGVILAIAGASVAAIAIALGFHEDIAELFK